MKENIRQDSIFLSKNTFLNNQNNSPSYSSIKNILSFFVFIIWLYED